ncbi:MAG: EF2563 family selenium-dependent molybdenum hydroxylase system protein [Anaerolineae bacterium]|nr:EF2563 family selenium-dependent molybdenum hydroxylase system protein [Anaerolineae bacterium]
MIHSPFSNLRVVVRGGGDLGSGIAYRLWCCDFPVLITELAHPLLIRRAVSFGSAIIEGAITVEGATARRADTLAMALQVQSKGEIAALIDPDGLTCAEYSPAIIIDARMMKRDPGPCPFDAPLVIGLGPGFDAPNNCDAVIETKRGHTLGRVIRRGMALGDSGTPEPVMGMASERVLRAPAAGTITGLAPIGAMVEKGQIIARVDGHPVEAPFAGVLRGLAHDGLTVQAGAKIADIDPRGEPAHCFMISEKSLAIGGGVLEAVFSSPSIWEQLKGTGSEKSS